MRGSTSGGVQQINVTHWCKRTRRWPGRALCRRGRAAGAAAAGLCFCVIYLPANALCELVTLGGEIFFFFVKREPLSLLTSRCCCCWWGMAAFFSFTAGQDDVQLLWTRLSIDPVLCPVDQRALRAVFCFTFSLNILWFRPDRRFRMVWFRNVGNSTF